MTELSTECFLIVALQYAINFRKCFSALQQTVPQQSIPLCADRRKQTHQLYKDLSHVLHRCQPVAQIVQVKLQMHIFF